MLICRNGYCDLNIAGKSTGNNNSLLVDRVKYGTNITSKARFRRRIFREPNLIPRIKYMKSSASDSVENGSSHLERLSRSSRLAQPGISALEQL